MVHNVYHNNSIPYFKKVDIINNTSMQRETRYESGKPKVLCFRFLYIIFFFLVLLEESDEENDFRMKNNGDISLWESIQIYRKDGIFFFLNKGSKVMLLPCSRDCAG